jgi:hypothetical protein
VTTALAVKGRRTLPEGLPELTLGWQILGWTADYLRQPDGPDAGEPWKFTPEQARFVLHWYAIDRAGRFTYRYGMLRRMKGWGKDPLAAALCCVEFVGPCRFAGWNGEEPVAEPHPAAWVQTAAVSKDQTRNTMTLFPGMLSKQAIDEYQIDLGKEIIYAHRGRCRIEAVTSSPRSLEGGRPTLVVKNETHHWIESNEGGEMAAVITRNAAKSRDGSSRVLAISNAHAPGEGSDAERDYEAHALGSPGVLYDSAEVEGVDLKDSAELRAALEYCRGDSKWLDIDRLIAEIQDPRTAPNTARRFYLNQLAASEERAFDLGEWQKLANKQDIDKGELITLGFDGSQTRDHTALVATHVDSGYQWLAGYWEPRAMKNGEMYIPVGEVKATVESLFERYDVWKFKADPFRWKEELALWAGKYNRPGRDVVVEFNTTHVRKMAYALAAYRTAIRAGDLSHDGDPKFAAAIQHSHKIAQHFVDDHGEPMWTIGKERPDSPLKIDATIAGCLSWDGRLEAIAAGAQSVGDWVVG